MNAQAALSIDTSTNTSVANGEIFDPIPVVQKANSPDDPLDPLRVEIVFVESNVASIDVLRAGIGAGKEVYVLDASQDGLQQIAALLAGRTGIDALHLISHGSEASVNLGALLLNPSNLPDHQSTLQAIEQSLSQDADILLYGCNVGAGAGQDFLDRLAVMTGADLAGSNNLSGNASLGGDWTLEASTGPLNTIPMTFESYRFTLEAPTITGANPALAFTEGNGYLDLDGTGDGVWASHTVLNQTDNNFTIEGWFQPHRVNSPQQHLVGNVQNGGYGIGINNVGLAWVTAYVSGSYKYAYDTAAMSANTWIHLAGVYTGSNLFLYRNGVLVSQTSLTGNIGSSNASGMLLGGNPGSAGGISEAYDGQMRDVRIWNDARTASEIVGNMDILSDSDNLLIRYSLHADANDSSGNSRNGTLAGNASFGTKFLNSNLTLADSDSTDMTGATLTISTNYASGQDQLLFTDQNGITGNWDSGAGTLTLSGTATVAFYQAALRSVQYGNTSDAPSTTTRTVTITVTDGTTPSAGFTQDISVTAVNDIPNVVGVPSDVTVIEDTANNFDLSAVTVADVDGDNLTVTLSATAGTFAAGSSGSVTVGGSGTVTLTLSGSAANINTWLDTVSNIQYTGASNANGDDAATFTLTANDGTADSNIGSGNIDITAVNDAPTRTSGALPTFTAVDEDSTNSTALSLGLSGVSYGPGGGSDESSQTLTYTVTAIPSFMTLWKSDSTTQVTTSSTLSETELQELKYKTVADANGTDNITWTVVDNGGTANGGVTTLIDNFSVTVNAVNDAPTGNVAISGIATQGQTLTADTSGVGDPDGLGTFSYQWKADANPIGGATSNTLVLSASEVGKAITVTVGYTDGDSTAESVTSNPTATVVTPTISLSVDNATVAEASGTRTVTATLNSATTTATTVTIGRKSSSTAALTDDFTLSGTTITIAAGETTGTATLTAVQDTLDEEDETAIVEITAVSGGNGATENGTQEASITITDDDDPPSISVANVSLTEGNSGSANMTFTATLSAASAKAISVTYATSDSTATAGSDYTAASGTLNFAAGETTKTFTVPILGDATVEGDETFTVTLSSPTNATLGTSTATGTITNDEGAPTVTLLANNATVAEASGTSTVTATLSAAAATDTTVTIGRKSTSTAALTSDFTLSGATITITAGQTTGTATLTAVQDTLDETDETAIVEITAVSGGNGATESGAQEASVTITDDDNPPSVSVATASLSEGNSGSANMTFTVALSAASTKAITVNYATSNGTATATSDYTAASGTLNFAAGETTKTFSVPILGDGTAEDNETLTVTLSSPTNATLGTSTASGTITNDDAAPTVSLSANNAAAAEASGSSTVTATLSGVAATETIITIGRKSTSTAALTDDFTLSSATITIAAGQTAGTATLTAVQDTLDEDNETAIVEITAVSGGNGATESGAQEASVTITDDDNPPSVSVATASLSEGNSGSANMTFTVALSAASTKAITVNYATSNGTATATSDYTAANGTLNFAAGETTKTFSVPILGDTTVEGNETFTITLSSPTNATLGTSTATGTITNDEAAPTITLSASNATVAEAAGASTVTATLSAVAATDTTVTIGRKATSTAALTSDFTLSSTTITIAAGQTTGTATLTAVQDTLDEDNETAIVEITAVSGGNGATESGTQETSVTITDDDTAPTISAANASLTEGNSGSANMSFTATLSAASAKAISVAYATSNGTATATSDYTAASGTLNFAAGETTKTFSVPILGDTTVEGNETFTITLSSPTNATLGTSTATGTITNDEAAPTITLSASNATVAEAAGASTVTATLSAVAATDTTVTIGRKATSTAALTSDFTLSSATITWSLVRPPARPP